LDRFTLQPREVARVAVLAAAPELGLDLPARELAQVQERLALGLQELEQQARPLVQPQRSVG
jgi:hypothetical protein